MRKGAKKSTTTKEPFDSQFVTGLLNKATTVKTAELINSQQSLDAIYMFSLTAYIPDSFTYEQNGKKCHKQDRLGFVLESGGKYYYINGLDDDLDRIANAKSSGWKFEIPADGVSCIKPEDGGHLFITHAHYTTLYFMSDLSTDIDKTI
jgi:hypothetical protein